MIVMIFFYKNIDLYDGPYVGWRESVQFNVEGLSSLKSVELRAKIAEVDFSIRNLPSLTTFYLTISGMIDEAVVTRLLDQLQHIQELYLEGNLCYFNLDNLFNLKKLSLFGIINESFNFELFKNLCYQLEDITICLSNMDEKSFLKLFHGYTFPYLENFTLMLINISILKKEFLDRLPMLRKLSISNCNTQVIESDTFSNLEQLCFLDLSRNRIQNIKANTFSKLKSLQKLDLSHNKLTNFDPKIIGLRESAEFCIRSNYIFDLLNKKQRI